jgi:hypothetical protein
MNDMIKELLMWLIRIGSSFYTGGAEMKVGHGDGSHVA